MKVKIPKNTLPGKASKILRLKELEEKNTSFDIGDIGSEFEKTFDSVGSDVKVLDGSFSRVRPIQSPTPMAGPSGVGMFKPPLTSTPKNKYEDISDVEEEGDLDITYNFQEDVVTERQSCEEYIKEVTLFIKKTQNMVEAKLKKRVLLLRKIKKYEKKLKNLQSSVQDIDRFITYGNRMPELLNNI